MRKQHTRASLSEQTTNTLINIIMKIQEKQKGSIINIGLTRDKLVFWDKSMLIDEIIISQNIPITTSNILKYYKTKQILYSNILTQKCIDTDKKLMEEKNKMNEESVDLLSKYESLLTNYDKLIKDYEDLNNKHKKDIKLEVPLDKEEIKSPPPSKGWFFV